MKPKLIDPEEVDARQRLVEFAERAEAVDGIRRGLEAMASGDGLQANRILEELREKLDSKPAP